MISDSARTRSEETASANEAGIEILESLARAARQTGLYGPTHPMTENALEQACHNLAAAAEGEKVELRAEGEGLAWNGRLLQRRDGNVARFRQAMHERMIAAIEIERHARPEEVAQLLMLLAEEVEAVMSRGGARVALREQGISGIRIEEVDFSTELLASEVAWVQLCRVMESEETGTLGGLVSSCVRSLRQGEGEMPASLVERGAGEGQEETEGGGPAEDPGVARVAWLIQQAGEKAYSRDEQQWESWRREVASRLAALSGEWRARIFRSPCQTSVGSTDVLRLIVEVMAPRDCVAAVLDHPDAIRAERSDGLALALGRIMSERERADKIEPLLHERALALGISEEMYQNVVGVLISRIRSQEARSDPAVGGRLERRADRPGPDVPPPESSESLGDLLETTDRKVVQRSRRHMLLEALEADLSPRQYGTVLGTLTKAAQDCAEDDELEGVLSVVRALRKEAGRDTSDESAWGSMAAGALARSGSERVVECIVAGLEGAEVEVGRRMIGMLGCLGDNGMGALLEIAQSEEREYAEQAVRVLVEKDGPESPHIRMLASKAEPSTLEQVIRWLVEVGDVKMAPPLVVLVDHAGEGTRLELVRLIRAREGGELSGVLVALLSDSSFQVRMAAVEALAAMRVREAVPELCNLVRRESEFGEGASLREAAVRALGAIGAEEAVPTLSEVLLGRSLMSLVAGPAARVAAAQMLAKRGGPRAQEALQQGTRVVSRTVRAACQRALARVRTAEREMEEGGNVG